MAKQSVMAADKPNPFGRLKEFLQEVRVEMSKVAWPSVDELKQSTTVVLLMLGIVGAIIFVFDQVFSFVILNILRLGS